MALTTSASDVAGTWERRELEGNRLALLLLMHHTTALAPEPNIGPVARRKEKLMSNLIVTLIIGGVVGWLASIVMKANGQMGILANVIVGIVGSYVGIALANALGVQANTTPAAWIVAVIGASVLIWLLRALGVFSRVASAR